MAEDHIPSAEEYALFREAYAETYPVRPLLNAIDAKDAEITRLTTALQVETICHQVASDSNRAKREEIELLKQQLFEARNDLDRLHDIMRGERPADETTPSLNCPTCGELYIGRGGQRGLPVMLSCPNRHEWPDPRGGCNS